MTLSPCHCDTLSLCQDKLSNIFATLHVFWPNFFASIWAKNISPIFVLEQGPVGPGPGANKTVLLKLYQPFDKGSNLKLVKLKNEIKEFCLKKLVVRPTPTMITVGAPNSFDGDFFH